MPPEKPHTYGAIHYVTKAHVPALCDLDFTCARGKIMSNTLNIPGDFAYKLDRFELHTSHGRVSKFLTELFPEPVSPIMLTSQRNIRAIS